MSVKEEVSHEEMQEKKEEEKKEEIQFIEPNLNKRMTSAKRKRVEKAKKKINLKQRRQELFEELSKIMLTEEELPNLKSSTKLGIDMDAENQENVIIMPKKVQKKEVVKKKIENKETEEKVTKIVVNDGKKTFGFGFVNEKMEVVDKDEKKGRDEKVVFVKEESSEESEENKEMSEDQEEETKDTKEEVKEEIKDNKEEIKEEIKEEVKDNKEEVKEEVKDSNEEIKERKNKRIIAVNIKRKEEIEKRRKELPILMEESNIIEGIIENECVIICGETGSGKTTQIPQILYEIGFGNEESEFKGMIGITQPRRIAATAMAKRVGEEMGEEGGVVSYQIRYDSQVKENTKIKFMTDGILLREIQSDVLLRKYSCIIIDEAHERNLNTDILIGILSRIVKLRNKRGEAMRLIIMSATLRVSEFTENQRLFKKAPKVIKVETRQYPVRTYFSKRTEIEDYCSEAIKKVNKIHKKLPGGGILVFLTGHKEIEEVCKELRNNKENQELYVLALYSSLEPKEQEKIFEKIPEGKRLCVISTDIAETSITIPNIKYVVDSGRKKTRYYDTKSGISSFVIKWISKASAAQRAGRAGRNFEGYCYRLYSSSIYENIFEEFEKAEIERMPLESVILTLKGMGIDKVINFPFPSQINIERLKEANKILEIIGILDSKERITEIGKIIKEYPLHPRLGKILYLTQKKGIEEIGLTLVSGLSVNDIFLDQECDRSLFINKDSDLISLILLIDTFRIAEAKKSITELQYCKLYGIKIQAFHEILLLRSQLCNILGKQNKIPTHLITPSEQIELRKIIASCFVDNVARLVRREELGKYINSGLRHAYLTAITKQPAVISSKSVLYGQLPDYIVFHEIVETAYKTMVGVTRVNFKWLEDASPDFITSFEKKSFN
ncbi:ATP-dependent RNA helicase, putative [Entamoeba dispar SAW760]|uniref:RNA helicase n=1 Tax=Entamoeba dispar (strain ATCC PRA-260 / SAW760) TaxID=370354 RepID=B0E818_ENTDS|nr:ATP-dependent RNA helicase, putative [Entamoeba dispar SAW760]EDR29329.1 ATP-dependent RNA helicase, putative [Entamoeba dispar SAW760]|eukprot:EDR29329.1 ATP-dependent RNA helicase, putative [Entamoeba dispar SAW760]